MAGLLERGCATAEVAGLLADCLVHLSTPDQLSETLDRLTQKLLGRSGQALAFRMLLAERLLELKQPQFALAVYEQLKSDPEAAACAPGRLRAIEGAIESLEVPLNPSTSAAPCAGLQADSSDRKGGEKNQSRFQAMKKRLLNLFGQKP